MFYPLKFEINLKEKVWGGNKLQKLKLGIESDVKYGESWELSCHENGFSVISNGKYRGMTFKELYLKSGEKLVGETIFKKSGEVFPLLIKFLDINDKLSVQVHPSDEYALEKEGELGKAECWYVMNASENAKLILGLKDGMSREKFKEKVIKRDFEGVFNEVSVKVGDFIYIKPGLVHASLEGSVFICEIQQNSDTTYRIYDFDREVDGVKRELHLEKALEVIDFENKFLLNREFNECEENGNKRKELVRDEKFNVDRIECKDIYSDKIMDRFRIFSVIKGFGEIIYNGVEKEEMKEGDTLFIPANLRIKVKGEIVFLKTWVD